jgi:hypothetical protein
MKPPAFQFYGDDFVAGTSDMTQAEVGAYILLLCRQWATGEIPADYDRLKLIAKGEVSDHVLAKFPAGKNARMEKVRAGLEEFRKSKSQSGKIGADKRWDKMAKNGTPILSPMANAWQTHGTPIISPMANTMANDSSPSPSPSPIIHTHTSSDQDSNLPTWGDIQAEAGLRAVPEASAKSFWDHHEGNALWINQHGKAINWRHKLTTWAAKDRTTKTKKTYANNGKNNIDRNAGTYNADASTDDLKARVR